MPRVAPASISVASNSGCCGSVQRRRDRLRNCGEIRAHLGLSTTMNQASESGVWMILRGLRNGLHYGAKIRAPHAFVMTMLFRDGPLRDKLEGIAKLTWEHSKNLGSFVLLYKTITYTLGKLEATRQGRASVATGKPGQAMTGWHAALAGAIGGWFVWGRYSSVNYQIVLYLLSRVTVAAFHVAAARGWKPFSSFEFKQTYPFLAAGTWAFVMWLFERERHSLHKSLAASMDFLYHGSNTYAPGVADWVMPWPTLAVLVAHWCFSNKVFDKITPQLKK